MGPKTGDVMPGTDMLATATSMPPTTFIAPWFSPDPQAPPPSSAKTAKTGNEKSRIRFIDMIIINIITIITVIDSI